MRQVIGTVLFKVYCLQMACDDFSINVTCGKFDFLFSNLLYKIAITLSVKLEYAVHAM